MPISTNFKLPSSVNALDLPTETNAAVFIAFLASTDPTTGRPWCPDVVAALPHLRAAFSDSTGPEVAFVEVGLRPEWRDPSNIYRTKWNVNSVPTLARYERISGKPQEVARLVEGEILDLKRLDKFIRGSI
ncbi:hypothetical protein UA08_09309 [Talaromyces atroroseus]|uniref:Thioredoxin domain-containing protein n=1 Tax=Talaromyces atroroseus TaxID=1441469 RepID=A0A1Q5Q6F0_TALAT|nr:hypothetical protein UA08_09309 [Talaromyces atroroseus]OKL55428.1 hypothetical protein UA08_09309 [Talaromyces atroroseus]